MVRLSDAVVVGSTTTINALEILRNGGDPQDGHRAVGDDVTNVF